MGDSGVSEDMLPGTSQLPERISHDLAAGP
jgi:hypothetical protein